MAKTRRKASVRGKTSMLADRLAVVQWPAGLGILAAGALCAVLLVPAADAQDDREVVRLSPQVRELPLGSSTPAISRSTIEKFLTGHRIVEPAVFEAAPYILASASGNLVIGAGDEVYLRGDWSGQFSNYEIYRPGNLYKDPASDEVLGMEVVHLGAVDIVADREDGVKTGVIRNNRIELRPGDRLLPREPNPLAFTFHPVRRDSDVNGVVLGLLGDNAMAAQHDAVAINLGARDDVRPGDLLGIYESGLVEKDPVTGETVALPGKEVGELMVYRSFDKISYGLVLDSTHPASAGYVVRAR